MKMESAIRELKRFEKDGVWLHKHHEELRNKYPSELVAVYGEKVVAHAKTISQLHAKIKKHSPNAFGKSAVEYLPKEKLTLIL